MGAARLQRKRLSVSLSWGGQAACAWPARLELKLDARGGTFSQQWLVFAEEWIGLPGERDRWPQEVKLDGQPAVVGDRSGVPQIRVQPGSYTVSGVFLWDTLLKHCRFR
jgi:hypothetical protein